MSLCTNEASELSVEDVVRKISESIDIRLVADTATLNGQDKVSGLLQDSGSTELTAISQTETKPAACVSVKDDAGRMLKDDKTQNDAKVNIYPLECPNPIILLKK